MKALYTILILFLFQTVKPHAQESPRDSLYSLLKIAFADSSKYKLQTLLTDFYIEKDRDSALLFANECIALANRNHMYLDVAYSLSNKGHALMHLQKLSESYACFTEALKIANDPTHNGKTWELKSNTARDKERLNILTKVYQDFASMMAAANNHEKSTELLLTAKDIAEKNQFLKNLGYIYLDLGQKYLDLHSIDTALQLERQAMQLLMDAGEIKPLGYCNMLIGNIWRSKKNYDSTLYYYRKSIAISSHFANYTNLNGTYSYLTSFYLHVKQNLDSAIYYAHARLNILKKSSENNLGAVYFNLAEAYQIKNNKDSVIKYQTLSISEKDKAFSLRDVALNNLQNSALVEQEHSMKSKEKEVEDKNRLRIAIIAGCLLVFSLLSFILYRNNLKKQKANKVLETTLSNLKSTQALLIQSEKMASLGELTAGIAHEIQNPLNFVNNFSEVSSELIDEMKTEFKKGDTEEGFAIAGDIKQNLEKILHHGKRAGDIVKGMLQHSRSSSATKEPTDINKLADEYLRLAYHGLRAKDKSFNATMKTNFDETIGNINIIPQDIGRVILNLINNAFYVVDEKQKAKGGKLNASASAAGQPYEPIVEVSTKKVKDKVEVMVKDNGNGIPQKILDKIFQPFFTTKPTGQGTGLGLSLSYDIVKAHGGELKVETKEGEGSEFIVKLPIV